MRIALKHQFGQWESSMSSKMNPPREIAVITALIGLLLTLALGQYTYTSGRTLWEQQAHAEMDRISELLVFWLKLAYEPALGLSMLMQGSNDVTQAEFTQALNLAHNEDTSTTRTLYAFVISSPDGHQVQLSNTDNALLRPGTSLSRHPAFEATIARSITRPTAMTAGPLFRDDDGHYKLFFAIPTASQTAQGFMVALADMEMILVDLHQQHVPKGLVGRLHTQESGLLLPAAAVDKSDAPLSGEHVFSTTFAGQVWHFTWQLFEDYQGGQQLKLSVVVTVAGTLISLLTTLLAYLWLTHRERAQQLDQAYQALQNASEKLIKSEKMASLGSLVAGIAHEMNTPIGNSLTVATALREKANQFCTTVRDGTLKKTVLNEFLDTLTEATALLENNTRRAAQLVGNFKQVAVDQSSERRRCFDLQQAIEETLWTLEPTLKHTHHQIHTSIPDGIQCDSYPGAIGQILTNLVSNSLQHGFENQPEGRIEIHAFCINGMVSLDYTDNGCGIPPAFIHKVFDPFFTTKLGKGGSGLGLHIIYNLVTGLLGGDIKITSEPGEGVRVTLHFPAMAPQEHDSRAANEQR